jgi:DNA recombination protein RmuC
MPDLSSPYLLITSLFVTVLLAVLVASFLVKSLSRFNSPSSQESNSSELQISYAVTSSKLLAVENDLAQTQSQIHSLNEKLIDSQQALSLLREEKSSLNAKLESEIQSHIENKKDKEQQLRVLENTKEQLSDSNQTVVQLKIQLEHEKNTSAEKIHLLVQAKEALSDQFKNLAQEILEEKSRKFSDDNHERLSQLLNPLKTKITEFQTKVEDVYVQEGKDRSALAEQVKQLLALNQNLSEEAKNLTHALKGSSKTQGNWGELVLERVLEASGLRKGEEFVAQVSQSREDGSKAQADVVIHLPEERSLVVDSKVSLNAYDEYMSSEDSEIKKTASRKHADSVKNHIKELSSKNYQLLYGVKSLDFVLMFIPIESAFMLAISNDKEIFMEAWKKNVLLVSPSTLLFVVRTVAHLWRQEAQSKNAQDIANRGAELYDKLVGFVEDLEGIGTKLKQAQSSYDTAFNKFSQGRGNVIRQAEMLKSLGVKPTKTLPVNLTQNLSSDDPQIESSL